MSVILYRGPGGQPREGGGAARGEGVSQLTAEEGRVVPLETLV